MADEASTAAAAGGAGASGASALEVNATIVCTLLIVQIVMFICKIYNKRPDVVDVVLNPKRKPKSSKEFQPESRLLQNEFARADPFNNCAVVVRG